MNMWDNTPAPSLRNTVRTPPGSPHILDEEELPNMPDITLEDDLHGLEEDLDNARRSQPPQPATIIPEGPGLMGAEPESLRATVEDASVEDANYVEEFPANLGAGAVWGEEVPFFEKLRRDQEIDGASRWGPFEDQDEWELSKWLIRNIGQSQINDFLNLNIVMWHRLLKFDSN
jgi:hypothetical protein